MYMLKYTYRNNKKIKYKKKKTLKTKKKTLKKPLNATLIVKNMTPALDTRLSNEIANNILRGTSDTTQLLSVSNSNSYSPEINKYLVSKTKTSPKEFFICNNSLLKINIDPEHLNRCLDYRDRRVKAFFLKNLKNNKVVCGEIIPPKQYLTNCWFNTMFVTFFISDKGRKFFKFFRQLMIEGRQLDNKTIPDNLAKAFFILNLAIEASQNRAFKSLNYLLNTNLIITKIYDSINSFKNKKNYSAIPNANNFGNPLEYYLGIMKYLNNKDLNIQVVECNTSAAENLITRIIKATNKSDPEIIILEILDNAKIIDRQDSITINNIEYVLDAAVIRDTGREHVASVLMCNGVEFAFDGASYKRLSEFKWKHLINKNQDWGFEGHSLKWNFTNCYQQLYYYRQTFL